MKLICSNTPDLHTAQVSSSRWGRSWLCCWFFGW